jgi:hypothetical protein
MVLFGYPKRITSDSRLQMSDSSKTPPYPETATRPSPFATSTVDLKDIVSADAVPYNAMRQYHALRRRAAVA